MIVMMLKWLGHASFLLKTGGKKIYIDPYAGDYDEKADAVLISHSHGDHCDLEKLAMVRTPETVIYTARPVRRVYPPGTWRPCPPARRRSLMG